MSKLDEMIKSTQWRVNWHIEQLEEEKIKLEALKEMKGKGND
jgi:hypothetical protein